MTSPRHRSIALVRTAYGLLALCLTSVSLNADEWALVVRHPFPAERESPILLRVSRDLPVGGYQIERPGGLPPLEAEVFEDAGRWLVAIVREGLPEGRLALRPAGRATPPADKRVKLTPAGPNLEIEVLGQPFTEYRTDVGAKPFLHPLIGPSQHPYTRAYPMADIPGEDRDHPHQRSFWFTHGSVNRVDFWSEQSKHGTIHETSRTVHHQGTLLGRIRTTDDWLGPDGRRVCSDERTLTVYATASVRVVDFEIEIRASDGPVTFGDTKEGMFGLRVASSMDVNKKLGGRIVNAEGQTDDKAWGKASPWVDYTGPVAGKTVGIAILNHPQSFRFPTTWHVRTYGLFAANPFGWHDFGTGKSGEHTLPTGESIRFGYRVILHEGNTRTFAPAESFALYGEPPSVERREP